MSSVARVVMIDVRQLLGQTDTFVRDLGTVPDITEPMLHVASGMSIVHACTCACGVYLNLSLSLKPCR